jgi:hypothetical protein
MVNRSDEELVHISYLNVRNIRFTSNVMYQVQPLSQIKNREKAYTCSYYSIYNLSDRQFGDDQKRVRVHRVG